MAEKKEGFLAKCFKSRKFTLGLSSILFVVLNESLGIGVSEATIQQIIELAMVTIGGLAVVDTASALKK